MIARDTFGWTAQGSKAAGWRTAIAALALLAGGCRPAPASSPALPSPTEPTSPAPTATETARPTVSTGPLVFHIIPEGTSARFVITERLRNKPNRVVGETDQVAGEIRVDPQAVDQAVLSPIVIQAGTLVTDSELRDGSIRAFILQSDAYPEIVFRPTSISGLPPSASVGDSLTFTVAGDLTIREITRPVVFDVSLSVESASRLTGQASATIRRSDFDLTIPSVPDVAEVADEILLRLYFAATRQE